MRTLGEHSFHLLMGALLFGSLLLDHLARRALPAWSMPTVGLVTLALGLVWVGLFAAHRIQVLQDEAKVLRDRLDRLSARTDVLEDDARRRRELPRP